MKTGLALALAAAAAALVAPTAASLLPLSDPDAAAAAAAQDALNFHAAEAALLSTPHRRGDRSVHHRRYTDWRTGNAGQVTFASFCDWTGGDIARAASASDGCGAMCLARPGCEKFTWAFPGVCYMKDGSASAEPVTNIGALCGKVVPPGTNVRYAWATAAEGRASVAADCDWKGGDLRGVAAASAEECAAACLADEGAGCFKFTFANGACALKSADAAQVVSAKAGAVCGVVAHSSSISWADAAAKAKTLVAQLSLSEKISLASGSGMLVSPCVGSIYSKASIGFQGFCLQDSPTGVRFARNVSAFPAGINLAATFDKTLMYNQGLYMGREARGKGVHVLLSPMMNIARAPAAGRNWEGAGGDPQLHAVSAAQQVKGIQASGVIATAKHFVLNEQETRRHGSNSLAGARALHEVYLKPFRACVEAGVAAVMCGYNAVNGSLACANPAVMSLLKDELGFQGFVMTDWYASTDTVATANGGSDMAMPGNHVEGIGSDPLFGQNLEAAVKNGQVPLARVDDMATRILTSWIKVGQNDGTFPWTNFDSWTPSNSKPIGVQADHKVHIRAVGGASTILTKNADATLPITAAKYKTIAVIGDDARAPSNPNACSDHGCIDGVVAQGWGSGTSFFPYLVAPVDGITAAASKRSIKVVSSLSNSGSDGANAAKSADLAVVFVAANSGEEYITVNGNKGDRNDLNLWSNGDALIAAVAATGKPTAVVVHGPGAVNMSAWLDLPNIKAIVYALMPGQEAGNAVADVLFGDVNPSGRLPFVVARNRDEYAADVVYADAPVRYDEGILVDYRWFEARGRTPVYPFGHGLSYTRFAYAPRLAVSPVDPRTGAFRVEVAVTNEGDVDGHEVVQLYVLLPRETCEAVGCAKELRDFERVWVPRGATVTVAFDVPRRAYEVWSVQAGEWRAVSGTVEVLVGASAADIRASASVVV
ncbi:glycoside hydrolase superfamily [Zopfochytrium polystomum]|nr:glycoside hydrolase superfamily [Zopfochytrium polystomum]